jgi:hypothetical protein
MEWLAAALAIVAAQVPQVLVPFECWLKPKWSAFVLGAPLSIGMGLLAAGLVRTRMTKARFGGWWILTFVLVLAPAAEQR